jgi:hypothetical protein
MVFLQFRSGFLQAFLRLLNPLEKGHGDALQLKCKSFSQTPVGAAEGCDLLILPFKIKRSQPSAAPTERSDFLE